MATAARPIASGPAAPRLKRSVAVAMATALAFAIVAGQLVRLAWRGQNEPTTTLSQAIPTSFARPDIVDRNGRLLATDIEVPSLYADPALILDRDEVAEKLARVLPDLDEAEVRRLLADRSRRFVWLRRGLTPRLAQAVHDLGLPGLAFRRELRRAYPAGPLAGHVIGAVNVDNRGLAGLEKHLDDVVGIEAVHGATLTDRAPLRTSLDLGVQHALAEELADAMRRYGAEGAAGLVMDVETGEIVAAQSLPSADPARLADLADRGRADRLTGGVYEMGSILKVATVALALEGGEVTPDTPVDVREPLTAGRHTIRDLHPAGRPLSVAEVLVRSSNVGAGLLALGAGPERQRAFLERLGLTTPLVTEAGAVAAPLLPEHWGRAETITVAYGHGLAVAPLQLAAAAAGLLNGGHRVAPTFLRKAAAGTGDASRPRVVSGETSRAVAALMRRVVTDKAGTGRRADAVGFHVGGKTGTAEMPGRGGYRETAVISSFLGAFPMPKPRYLTLVSVFEPRATAETAGQITAGLNAAPATRRLVERIAPMLGVLPDRAPMPQQDDDGATDAAFDGARDAKY